MKPLTDADTAHEQLTQLAVESDAVSALMRPDGASWTIAFEDSALYLIEWADAPPRMVLTAEIGVPAANRKAEVLEAALSYNVLWRETSGMRIGRGGEQNALMLVQELQASHIEQEGLFPLLDRFAGLVQGWSVFVSDDSAVSQPEFQALAFSDPRYLTR